ncbi:(R)-stereoselective amidase [Roseovarius albus]|uniref:(R)-stereoselective amidase n=1 Tax=Roseovarius albus TaxID=1247867 RepID=A0A1X6ZLU3_9RHOB|nr:carbon-nitrogen hydrolase family protein [Roseovarius albus]SLN55007.1 (R)-stereoselective amidase [Roseovarius albus]
MTNTFLKIAIYQMSAAIDAKTYTGRIKAAMHRAKSEGADLLIAPELAMTGYGQGEVLRDLAQPTDGPWVQEFQAFASEIDIGLVAGFPERDGDECYISAMCLHRDGTAPVIYRKSYLYGDYEKSLFQNNSLSTVITEYEGVNLGFLICYDVEFPENVRRLAQAGAEVVIVPTALPKGPDGHHIASRVIPVRAYESQVCVVYANHADADDRFHYQGMSCAYAPDGSALVTADAEGETLIYANIDTAAYQASTERNPYLADLGRMEQA